MTELQKNLSKEDQRFRADLDQLENTVSRLKDISIQIGQELDEHSLILNKLEHQVDNSQKTLDKSTKKINKLIKNKSCIVL